MPFVLEGPCNGFNKASLSGIATALAGPPETPTNLKGPKDSLRTAIATTRGEMDLRGESEAVLADIRPGEAKFTP